MANLKIFVSLAQRARDEEQSIDSCFDGIQAFLGMNKDDVTSDDLRHCLDLAIMLSAIKKEGIAFRVERFIKNHKDLPISVIEILNRSVTRAQ